MLLAARITVAVILYTGTLILMRNKELDEALHYLLKRKSKER